MEDTPFTLYDKILAELYNDIIVFTHGSDIIVTYDGTEENDFFFKIALAVAELKQKPLFVHLPFRPSSIVTMNKIKKQYPSKSIHFAGLRGYSGLTMSYLDFLCRAFGKYSQNISLLKEINKVYYGE